MSDRIQDKNSPEWLRVQSFCSRRLAELREQNDGDHDVPDTAKIRGNIAFAKELLALADKPEDPDMISDTSYIE